MAAEASGNELKFKDIACAGKAGLGLFKLTTEQFGWHCMEKGLPESQVSYRKSELVSAEWQRACGREYGLLKLLFKGDGGVGRFSGFRLGALKELQAHLKTHFRITLAEKPVATAGWTWADWAMDAGGAEFRLLAPDGRVAAEVPVTEVAQVNTMGKGELNLEFQALDVATPGDEFLHEMRLFVPGQGEVEMTAEKIRDTLMQHLGASTKGEAIIRVPGVMVAAPRGKHDFEFFDQVVKIHGKTQTYSLSYKSIERMFLLQLSAVEVAFVLGLSVPLRQGQQTHSFLVLTFSSERKVPIELTPERIKRFSLPEAPDVDESYLMPRLFLNLVGKAVISHSREFQELLVSAKGGEHAYLRCSHKTQPGYLYALKKSMIFILKPVVWLRYDEIDRVKFVCTIVRRNSFDLHVFPKGPQAKAIEFMQLDKTGHDALNTFLQKMGVSTVVDAPQLASSATRAGKRAAAPVRVNPMSAASNTGPDGEDEEDEDFEGGDSESDVSFAESEEEDKPQPKRARGAR